ncbi:MAG: FAD-dependent oxidoreductase [Pirellulaceae bacterium]
MATSIQSMPLWLQAADTPKFSTLRQDLNAEVCVVGAGMAGLCTAYLLAREGRHVVVLTQGSVGEGETMRTTAHLTNVLDTRYFELESLHGSRGAELAAASHARAIDRIEEIVRQEGIACDFERVDGYLFTAPGQSSDILEKEFEAAGRAGMSVERVLECPVASLSAGPCLRFPRQAQFHPLRFVAALAEGIERGGGRIYTDTHVEGVTDGTPTLVTTSGGPTVSALDVVVTTDTPVSNRVVLHTKQAAYRSYVIASHIPTGSVPTALFWDTADPYHYVRLHRSGDQEGHLGDVLIVGGEDHKTGQAHDTHSCYARLEAWMRERFPMVGDIDYRWSGQIMEPNDGLAFIGSNPGDDHLYVATGASGNGMTYGMISGMMFTDLLADRPNAWADVYAPGRITLRAAKEFLRENLNVAAWYTDLLTPGEISSSEEIPRGSGAVLRRGMTKWAVYRDEHGTLHLFSAICPHLKGVVHWNPAEQSWDCPCHGSRFTCLGEVIHGPAIKNLDPVEDSSTR